MKKAVQVPKSTALLERIKAEAQFADSSIQPRVSAGAAASAEEAFPVRRRGEVRELRDA
jgi:hypothetical protein